MAARQHPDDRQVQRAGDEGRRAQAHHARPALEPGHRRASRRGLLAEHRGHPQARQPGHRRCGRERAPGLRDVQRRRDGRPLPRAAEDPQPRRAGRAPRPGQELLHGHEHPARRLRPPGRHLPVRHRPGHLGARRQLQGPRARQPVRRGHQLLPQHRRGEPGAHRHGQLDPRGRAPAEPDGLRRLRSADVRRREEGTMDRYPNIADHGLIGDLQTAALVTTDGCVDFFCAPRFDSPSVFASLLDADRGGHFRIAPDRDDYVTRQLYFPDTAILITRYMTPDGVGEVHDFMPVAGTTVTDQHRLVRQLKVVRGTMRFAAEIQPRFDYGRKPHKLELTEDGAVFQADGMELTMHGVASPGQTLENQGIKLERDGDGLRWTRTLRAGQTGGVVLEWMGGTPRRMTPEQVQRLTDETAQFWRGWLSRSRYTGRWRDMVNRSAMTLKLMTYRPTGAVVAAPTTGLPEQAGGERNWDYRYTWVRDGSFSIYALLSLGYVEEAAAFGVWLRDRAAEYTGEGRP